jgi:hypothetical protein
VTLAAASPRSLLLALFGCAFSKSRGHHHHLTACLHSHITSRCCNSHSSLFGIPLSITTALSCLSVSLYCLFFWFLCWWHRPVPFARPKRHTHSTLVAQRLMQHHTLQQRSLQSDSGISMKDVVHGVSRRMRKSGMVV